MNQDMTANEPRRGPSRLRKIFIFFLGFPVSLALGWLFGILTSPETYRAAEQTQRAWYTTVAQLSPVALVTGYGKDVLHVMGTGDTSWAPEAPVTPREKSAEEIECDRLERALAGKCREMRATGNGMKCVNYDDEALSAFVKQCPRHPHPIFGPRLPANYNPHAVQPQPKGKEIAGRVMSAPLFAIARTWNRITYEGGLSYVLAVVMLLGGVFGFMLLHARFFSPANRVAYFPDSIWSWLLLVPPGIIACASVVCFFLKYIMLGALGVFGWVTGLAGLCCAATGTAGYAWWISHKFAQYSLGKVVAPKA